MSGLSTFVCACNDGVLPVTLNPLAEAQASISRVAHSILFLPLLSRGIPLQRAETSSRLLLGLGIG
ncbi:hypothetical protein CC80DRAFT_494454 [Byssothecium circinans]|uniref:Uncharacterized protein n=1 Tax=Byssothecium circinans TaxID=147558 RepID=A0A6A5TMD6_9PLEO|nr:hypothetical protein CC80DRAFT_494454 [Byssothecium circinans]